MGILLQSGPQAFAKSIDKAVDYSFVNKDEICSITSEDQFLLSPTEYEEGCILVKFDEGIDISTTPKVFKTIETIVNSDPSFGSVLTAKHVFSGLEMNVEKKYLYDSF